MTLPDAMRAAREWLDAELGDDPSRFGGELLATMLLVSAEDDVPDHDVEATFACIISVALEYAETRGKLTERETTTKVLRLTAATSGGILGSMMDSLAERLEAAPLPKRSCLLHRSRRVPPNPN